MSTEPRTDPNPAHATPRAATAAGSAAATSLRYRAFLSYSHRDARLARRIHRELESWRIDADLIGRDTPVGPVPKSLRPIFLDREELAGGGVLNDAIRTALAESQCLIVLCSPDAARSAYVNEEIRLFKAMGRADRVIPLVVAGEPGDPANTCFPAALTQDFDADGQPGAQTVEPLAADARDAADGWRRALAKVVAGLLGLPLDEIARRAERAARRRTRVLVGVATLTTAMAVAAGGFAWLSETRRVVAERNYQAALKAADSLLGDVGEELILIEGIQLETTRGILERATSIIDELSRSLPDAVELQFSRVGALGVMAKALHAKGDKDGALAKYREAEALAQQLAAASPGDLAREGVLAMIRWRLGAALAGSLEPGARSVAIEKLQAALGVLARDESRLARNPDLLRELASAETMLALLLAFEGRPVEAARHSGQASALAQRLADAAPDDWRNRVFMQTTRVAEAELLVRQGEREAALEIYRGVEARLADEARLQPDMPQIRTMLGNVQNSVARLLGELGWAEQAEAARQRSTATISALAAGDAENRGARLAHADKQAEEAVRLAAEGAVTQAAAQFRESRQTLEAMLAATPDKRGVEASLQLSLMRAAHALGSAGIYAPAEAAARRLLELRESRLQSAPDEAEAAKALSLALHQLASVLDGKGELEEALALRRRQLQLEQQLAGDGRDNRRLLLESHQDVGLLAWRLSRRDEALPHYVRHVELLAALVAEKVDDQPLRIQLGHGLLNLGELRALNGDRTGALAAFRQCLELRRAVVEGGDASAERLTELAWAEARLAQFGDAPAARWRQVEALLSRADAQTPLGDMEDELLTAARIAISGRPPR